MRMWAGLEPLLSQVVAAETLLDDAIRLAKVAGAADIGNRPTYLSIKKRMVQPCICSHPDLSGPPRSRPGAFVRGYILWIDQSVQ